MESEALDGRIAPGKWTSLIPRIVLRLTAQNELGDVGAVLPMKLIGN